MARKKMVVPKKAKKARAWRLLARNFKVGHRRIWPCSWSGSASQRGSMPQAPQRVIATTTRVTTTKSWWILSGSKSGNSTPAEGGAHDKTQQGQNPHHGQGAAPVPLRDLVHQEGIDGGGGHGGADAEEGKQEHPLVQQGAAVGLGSQRPGPRSGKNGMTATLRSMPPQM